MIPLTAGVWVARKWPAGRSKEAGRAAASEAPERQRSFQVTAARSGSAASKPPAVGHPAAAGAGKDKELPSAADIGELAEFGHVREARVIEFGRLDWEAGDRWRVETHYLQMQRVGPEEWSKKPIVWEFVVRGVERLDGRDVWVVDAHPVDLEGMAFDPGGTVYVATEDHTVVAVRDRVQQAGEVRERYLKFEDPEGSAPTLIPIELPAPGVSARELPSSSGVLPPDPFQPDPKVQPPATSGRVIDVEFEAFGVTVRQRWDANNGKWPLYSRSASRVSYLR